MVFGQTALGARPLGASITVADEAPEAPTLYVGKSNLVLACLILALLTLT